MKLDQRAASAAAATILDDDAETYSMSANGIEIPIDHIKVSHMVPGTAPLAPEAPKL